MTLFTVVLLGGCGKEKTHETPTIKVKAERPKYMKFQKKIQLQGNVEPKNHANICARTDGVIDVMNVDEGSFVKKGELLFQSDKLNLETAVKVTEDDMKVAATQVNVQKGMLAISKAKYLKAQKDHKRSAQLIKHKAIALDTFEKTELQQVSANLGVQLEEAGLQAVKAKLEQARSNLEIAQKYYRDSQIKAPFDGVITLRYKEAGEYAKKGDKILRMENPKELEISLLMSAKYYSEIKPGKTKAIVRESSGKKLTETTVAYRAPTIDDLSRTFEIEVDLTKVNSFISGMLCSVDIILEERMGYGVPQEATLLRSGDRYVVYTPKNGKAKEMEIKKGITDNGFTELKNIDGNSKISVIVEGQGFLNEGAPISVIEQAKAESNKKPVNKEN